MAVRVDGDVGCTVVDDDDDVFEDLLCLDTLDINDWTESLCFIFRDGLVSRLFTSSTSTLVAVSVLGALVCDPIV